MKKNETVEEAVVEEHTAEPSLTTENEQVVVLEVKVDETPVAEELVEEIIEQPVEKKLEDFEEYKILKEMAESIEKEKIRLEKRVEELEKNVESTNFKLIAKENNVENIEYFEFLYNKAKQEKDFNFDKWIKDVKIKQPHVFIIDKKNSLIPSESPNQNKSLSVADKLKALRNLGK